jgi:hypothetical protein
MRRGLEQGMYIGDGLYIMGKADAIVYMATSQRVHRGGSIRASISIGVMRPLWGTTISRT